MEQWQLVGLITRRSQVRILPPLPRESRGVQYFTAPLTVCLLCFHLMRLAIHFSKNLFGVLADLKATCFDLFA